MQVVRRRALVAIVAVVLAMAAQPGVASAHTDLDFTLPADGASVGAPVGEVTVAFTSPVELVGNGFEALDPQGTVLQPPVVTDDNQVFLLQFDPPLVGGAVGIRWEVRADDGHVLDGSISFIVESTAPTTPPPTTAPAVTVAPTTAPSPPETTTSAAPAPTTTIAEAAAVSSTTGPATTVPPISIVSGSDDGSNTGLLVAIAAGLVIAAVGFFVIRSRTSATS